MAVLALSQPLDAQAANEVGVALPKGRLAYGMTAITMHGKGFPDDGVVGGGAEVRWMTTTGTLEFGLFAAPVTDAIAEQKKMRFGLALSSSYNVIRLPNTRVYLGGVAQGMFNAVAGTPKYDNILVFAGQLGIAQRIGRHWGLYIQGGPGIGGAAGNSNTGLEAGSTFAAKAGLFYF